MDIQGIDTHRANLVVCVWHSLLTSTRPKGEEDQFETTRHGLKECRNFLRQFELQAVGMESTGVYWKTVWYALYQDFEFMLANPVHMKATPGHKTDKKDIFWIAKLTRIRLLPKSFVPNENIQKLRELTRQGKHLVEARTEEAIMGHFGRNLMALLCDDA